MECKPLISIRNGVPRHPDFRMREPVNLNIQQGEQVAIIGPNAAGKTRLVEILTGRWPLLSTGEISYHFPNALHRLASENIRQLSFRDSYGDSDQSYYLQQRWNQHDIDDATPTVGQLLKAVNADEELRAQLYTLFQLEPMLDKYIISLSSGELRKFQLTRTLLTAPRLLILDNPFIGLDVHARELLRNLLDKLVHETDLHLILVVTRTQDIPLFVNRIIRVEGLRVIAQEDDQPHEPQKTLKSQCPQKNLPSSTPPILRFSNVTIRYGSHVILKDLSWTVHRGERWALSGVNGSGKSTLLSLVCADNPQAYACDIELFGKRRGTGESIWDIKRHIGYVSPEMHRAYMKDLPAIDIVASGLHDSVGLYVRPRPEQRQTCIEWMERLGIANLADRTFLRLSSGEQRLCLLARAFVKTPDLLILDEPFHGLDDENRLLVTALIEAYCRRQDVTLIIVSHYEDELPACITHRLELQKPECS
ncbi:MAG: ATP-binding cassette domain-containing protein [Bacteroidaceae bacterium]|nr:ATP-binding cassette domain-containing protein [Bacteroidaceae bacterium]